MGLLRLLLNDPATFILLSIPLLYSIIIHELAHGWVAYKMGDPTAKLLGRLSLNPLKHLDPIGTLMLFVVGFGWAKPVPVNFSNLRGSRKGIVFVSAAGIAANTLLAFTAFLLNRLLSPSPSGALALLLYYMAQVNIMLAAFNLIPIPPLDGSKILLAFTSGTFQRLLLGLERYGFFIIIGLLYLGVLDPLIDFFRWMILMLIRLLLP
ncbi:MAG TPA: site-2 protease family protein [Desulfobacterales bacterium]|nr:site-2 protease family protein [Desulfobacterales bacterium]